MNLPSNLTDSTRRRWVKQFVLGSAAALVGPRWTSSVLAELTSTGPGPGIIRLKASLFPALADLGGSIQLRFISYIEPFTLNRVTADRFVALDSICTHQGCTVGRFIVANNRMRCPCHGSRYDIEGRVFRDANGNSTEPAPEDLNRFVTSYDAATDIIAITIPDLALHIESIGIHHKNENGQVRLKLVFPVTFGATYQISHQADLSSSPQIISFSPTPIGPANQNTISPTLSGNFTAYVDASGARGFFSVGLKLSPA